MFLFQPIVNFDYKECFLTESTTEWYITYYVKNPSTDKLKRVRIKVNHIKPITARRKEARKMMAAINQRLAMGWNPLIEMKAPKTYEKLFDAIDVFLGVKGREAELSSSRIYTCLAGKFKTWCLDNGLKSDSYVCAVSKSVAVAFMNDLERKLAPKSYNNNLAFYKGLWVWFVERGYADGNPFADIPLKSKRRMQKNRRMLTDDELQRAFSFIKSRNPEYLAMCLICYCCFIRPKEIALLRCKDIDLERQLIHIDASIAKNDNSSFRTIPDDMMPVMRTLDLSHPDWYVFGDHKETNKFTPSDKLMCSRKIAKWWDTAVRPACGFGIDVKFYSLKDTGITNMLSKGVAINVVQHQADHSSVAMTAIYVGNKPEANQQLKDARIVDIGK